MIDIDELEQLEKEAHMDCVINPEWGYLNEHEEYVVKNGFVITLLRDGILHNKIEHFRYATACMNVIPHIIRELKAAREAVATVRRYFNGAKLCCCNSDGECSPCLDLRDLAEKQIKQLERGEK